MRRILIDRARARLARKHGGDRQTLDALAIPTADTPEGLLELDEALRALAAEDEQKAELVRLRVFAGLTFEQAGRALGRSPATADRHWAYAKAWLFDRLCEQSLVRKHEVSHHAARSRSNQPRSPAIPTRTSTPTTPSHPTSCFRTRLRRAVRPSVALGLLQSNVRLVGPGSRMSV